LEPFSQGNGSIFLAERPGAGFFKAAGRSNGLQPIVLLNFDTGDRLLLGVRGMGSTPTLKDLAEKLGLSVATVSFGLRHAGNVSEATCKRIEAAAREMGYIPNPHAAALSTRSHTAGAKGVPLAVIRRPLGRGKTLYPISYIISGITERALALGYRVECFDVKKDEEIPHLLRMLFGRGFQGIFLPPIWEDDGERDCDWSAFSVVGCGRYDKSSVFHTVRQEIFEGTRFLLNEMTRRGYRRICLGLVRHEPTLLDDYARVAVAKLFDSTGSIKSNVFLSPINSDLSDFVKWAVAEKADAVIGFTGVHYDALRDAGIKVPQDMAFACLNLHDEPPGIKISGITPREKLCGIVAANRMDTMIRHHERGIPEVAEQIAIPPIWHPGETLPARDIAPGRDEGLTPTLADHLIGCDFSHILVGS